MTLFLLNGDSLNNKIRELEAQFTLSNKKDRDIIAIKLEALEEVKNSAVKVNFSPISVDNLTEELTLKIKSNGNH
jgi:hypothetical protein